MIGLLQRVTCAEVVVAERSVGRIDAGLLVLVCAERGDGDEQADRLLEKLVACRVFSDGTGRMNLSLRDVKGGLLLGPQFTLAADTRKGSRPSFTPAAPPEEGRRLFHYMLARARLQQPRVEAGEFGADMKVSLTNDGPVTIWLQVPPSAAQTPDK
jgi:D-tyrosyl-tRNA(Tyr) deacylase